jgi:transcriptional regulator with XRE-family HTH domain
MVLLRHLVGDALRRLRLRQGRTLREVSAAARVSLGYLSEVERGQKEASSELLASICGALGAPLSQVLREVSDNFALAELQSEPVFSGPVERSIDAPARSAPSTSGEQDVPVSPSASHRVMVPRGLQVPGGHRMVVTAPQRRISVRGDGRLVPQPDPLLDQASMPEPEFDRESRDITNMVPV